MTQSAQALPILQPCPGRCTLQIKDQSITIRQWVRPVVTFHESTSGEYSWAPIILAVEPPDDDPKNITNILQDQWDTSHQPDYPGYFEDTYVLNMFNGAEVITLNNAYIQSIDMDFPKEGKVDLMKIVVGFVHCTQQFPT